MRDFILGIIFGTSIFSIMDSLTELFQIAIEVLKAKLNTSIAKSHLAIKNLQGEKPTIGFSPPEDKEDEE